MDIKHMTFKILYPVIYTLTIWNEVSIIAYTYIPMIHLELILKNYTLVITWWKLWEETMEREEEDTEGIPVPTNCIMENNNNL